MSFEKKLDKILLKYQTLSQEMAAAHTQDKKNYIQRSKELSDLRTVAEAIAALHQMQKELSEAKDILNDTPDNDLKEMAREEIIRLLPLIEKQQTDIKVLLLPKDATDTKNAILEVRAGTGGREAALFASDILKMYQRYSDSRGWKLELLSLSETELGGVKEAITLIRGKNVFARLKFESGVHRVQRVPTTEASGRIHTSAATVVVLPEVEDIDIELTEEDLRIDVYRSSGPGGQSVNTTDSAVRITHIPTGIVVQQQDEKSQHKNKAKALKILRSRVYEAERKRKDEERASTRKHQIGSGDRSERIRTYNFPQSRVTDHRINLTLYKLEDILIGHNLDHIIDALTTHDHAEKLAAFSHENVW